MIVNKHISMKLLLIKIVKGIPNIYENTDSSKVSEDYEWKKKLLRIIYISYINVSPCCRTHLTRTTQVQDILILPNQTNIRSSLTLDYILCLY